MLFAMLTSAVCIEECRKSTHWMALDGMVGGTAWTEITLHISNYVPLSINLHHPQKFSNYALYSCPETFLFCYCIP
jgi:hypothetical protein